MSKPKALDDRFLLSSYCDHPMIQRGEDGGTYCTECKQRVA